ncbi:MAG TPA: hypothetical protein VJ673_23460 [Aromatoleum sp.]|uniref:hypothetical protein n=1 Tax=Aromatoleum sp. TaxID=2307007 RepID=UPI002B4A1B55|nr:hypothetical protein [Aromatoleum sp.]HJV28657.1 hypothetical protein [Aromatoleum sp.]
MHEKHALFVKPDLAGIGAEIYTRSEVFGLDTRFCLEPGHSLALLLNRLFYSPARLSVLIIIKGLKQIPIGMCHTENRVLRDQNITDSEKRKRRTAHSQRAASDIRSAGRAARLPRPEPHHPLPG